MIGAVTVGVEVAVEYTTPALPLREPVSDVARRVWPSMFIPPKNETFEPPPAPNVATLVELFEKISNPAEVREVRSFVPRSGRVEVETVEVAVRYPTTGDDVATNLVPSNDMSMCGL